MNEYILGQRCPVQHVQCMCGVSQCTHGKIHAPVQVCTGLGTGCAVWQPVSVPVHTPTRDLCGLPLPMLLPKCSKHIEQFKYIDQCFPQWRIHDSNSMKLLIPSDFRTRQVGINWADDELHNFFAKSASSCFLETPMCSFNFVLTLKFISTMHKQIVKKLHR